MLDIELMSSIVSKQFPCGFIYTFLTAVGWQIMDVLKPETIRHVGRHPASCCTDKHFFDK